MHLNTIILVFGIGAILLIIIASGILINIYNLQPFREIRDIVISAYLLFFIPISSSIADLVHGGQYNLVITVFDIIGLTFGGIGALGIWYNLMKLRGEKLLNRHKLLITSLFYSHGMLAFTLEWHWHGDEWLILYSPFWSLHLTAIPIAWLLSEMILLAYKNYETVSKPTIGHLLTLIGFIITFLAIPLIVYERTYYPHSNIIFVTALSTGFAVIACGFIVDPNVLYHKDKVGANFLIISNKISGIALVEYEFPRGTVSKSKLFSGAMSGILNVLGELTNRADLPPSVSYVDLTIIIEQHEGFIAYLVAEREINMIRQNLVLILQEVEKIVTKGIFINPDNKKQIISKIEEEFNFLY